VAGDREPSEQKDRWLGTQTGEFTAPSPLFSPKADVAQSRAEQSAFIVQGILMLLT
jgi:hypothetical protein